MISDVLADAIREIEDYQSELPETYAGVEAALAKVKLVMDAMRAFLDCPIQDMQLLCAISVLDTTELRVIFAERPSRLAAMIDAKLSMNPGQHRPVVRH
jgi:hypothetical protein